ncbi:serine/threonine-protein kinase [Iningainema tapete]|uniref:non-specific serine/threonine protein kinase n=1 Tax=Iningainema tapete BLCC-T55 TaxID=2748662 RepID=A0A8J7BXK7_9CYAN|nr:serine/threonine-protein kinase [Iningainema tapete]MBD2773103.1 protein kinase [Iningainema tapete BLCC-T55]
MRPPITAGTILQNRYRIIQTLGQGGFGRTYLAEDQRRFNELCAIKELMPTATGTEAWEKSLELFQREAATLYKIQHPQIPQFRENFEQDQRLFLVQEYIAGKTYRTILDERKAIGGAFTEREVLQLMRSLLPVLEHIHSRGIIHRDISPDNIILRNPPMTTPSEGGAVGGTPVLIDFGVVKEIVTRVQSPNTTTNATSVGKLGYAPNEQMQTGRAYPNSDLYALAVTAIVLLTGKEPNELFDENQLTWNWQPWVTVNPQFASVLNRMLSYRPSTRYQNANEVLQALQEQKSPTSNVSNVQTVAVARRPDPPVQPKAPLPHQPARAIPEPASGSILDNPWAMAAIGITVFILAGVGSWAIVSSIRNQSREPSQATAPQTFPSPVISGATPTPTQTPQADISTPTPTPTPTPTSSKPIIKIRRLNFGLSNTVNKEGTLQANEIIRYNFFARKGQQLTALFAQEGGVLLSVLGPDRQPIEDNAKLVTFYRGELPVTGSYSIELSPLSGVSESDYSLNVGLENLVEPTPTPTPTEIPLPTPTESPIIPTISPTLQPPVQPYPTPNPTTPGYNLEQPPGGIPTPELIQPRS